MAKVGILIDWVEHNYGACPENEDIACVATGRTLEEIKKNIVEAIEFHISGMIEDGEPIPSEFLGKWEPDFHLTTRAQLRYAENFITRKALAAETGINEKQLCHYASGLKKPRPAMQKRISDGILAIGRRLTFIL